MCIHNFCESFLDFDEADVGLKKQNDSVIEWFVRVQQNFFVNENIDQIIKFENLQTDFNDICIRVHIPHKTLPHLKSQVKKIKTPYQDYYNYQLELEL